MKTKCQIALSILLTFSLLGHAGQEGRGGHPLKDRFRRMGFFLSQHLEKNQIRLSARLKSLEIFKSVVKEVPIQLVEKFPDTVGSVASEVLVAITINDPKSPTGTTILLHHERFEKALAQFDKGEEAVVTIISDPNQIKIVTRENVDRFFVEQSFLSFCFHEYLLAAKEADTQTKLSSLLTASRDAYVNWSKATPGLKDESLSLKTFYFRGPVVLASGDVAADNQKALKLFYEEYDKQKVKEKNELAVKQLVEHVRKKVPVLKVTSSESSPYLYQIQYYNDYSQPGWSNYHEPVIAGVYYEQTFRSELVVDSDRKIDCSYLDGMSALSLIEGEAFTYREFVEDKKLKHIDALEKKRDWELDWEVPRRLQRDMIN
mgnify:FL=1